MLPVPARNDGVAVAVTVDPAGGTAGNDTLMCGATDESHVSGGGAGRGGLVIGSSSTTASFMTADERIRWSIAFNNVPHQVRLECLSHHSDASGCLATVENPRETNVTIESGTKDYLL